MFGDQSLSKLQVVVVVISAPKKSSSEGKGHCPRLVLLPHCPELAVLRILPQNESVPRFHMFIFSFRLHQDDWSGCGSSQE